MADYDISIKPGDFIDPSTLLAESPGACFLCGQSTWCLDIDFMAYFCDSQACNDQIDADLRAADERLNARSHGDVDNTAITS